MHTHAHTHPFNGPFSGTTQVSRYQKGKTNLDFTEARDRVHNQGEFSGGRILGGIGATDWRTQTVGILICLK